MKIKAVSGIMLALFIFSMFSVNMIGITVAQVDHDIAVVSVTPYPTKVGLGLGELVDITVVIENQGTENETFSVTVYYDNTTIQTQDVVDQAPETNTTLTFTWNTTSITAGTYSINATASIVPDETDTADNTLISLTMVNVASLYIAVLPRRTVDITLTPGQNYTVSIYTNYNGSDIWGYEFTLTYNPVVLHGVEVVNGDLITEEGTLISVQGEFDNTVGTLSLTGAAALNMTTISYVPLNSTGPGILANVTFTIVGLGDSSITFEYPCRFLPETSLTKLKRVDGTNIIDYLDDQDPDPTRGKFLHGYFRNTLAEVTHDIAVVSVTPYPTMVKADEPVNITVVVENQGTVAEKFDVKTYYDYVNPNWLIGEESVILEADLNTSLTFTWKTTEVPAGTHTITAIAEPLSAVTDVNPNDNTLQSIVYVRVICIRADGSIDPPTASISSADNVTYTFTGNINKSIVVERDNIVVDGAGYALQRTGAYDFIGISLSGRSNVTIKNMEIKTFSCGIALYKSSNNSITGNNITNNSKGIRLTKSSSNIFYHNNFIDNQRQVYLYESFDNAWDNGYPSGGNYWSDYTDVDLYSGPNQDVLGSDRI